MRFIDAISMRSTPIINVFCIFLPHYPFPSNLLDADFLLLSAISCAGFDFTLSVAPQGFSMSQGLRGVLQSFRQHLQTTRVTICFDEDGKLTMHGYESCTRDSRQCFVCHKLHKHNKSTNSIAPIAMSQYVLKL